MYFGVDGCLDIALDFNLKLNRTDRLADILKVSEKREHCIGAFNSVLLIHSQFLVLFTVITECSNAFLVRWSITPLFRQTN